MLEERARGLGWKDFFVTVQKQKVNARRSVPTDLSFHAQRSL